MLSVNQKTLQFLGDWNVSTTNFSNLNKKISFITLSDEFKVAQFFLAAVIFHYFSVYILAELVGYFNLKPNFLKVILAFTLIPIVYVIGRYKSILATPLLISLAVVTFANVLNYDVNIFENDGLHFHLPKILFQGTNGTLESIDGWGFQFPSIISMQDNISMMYYLAMPQRFSLIIANQTQFVVLLSLFLLSLSRRSGYLLRAMFLILITCTITTLLAELRLMKPNSISPAFWITAVTVFLAGVNNKEGRYISAVLLGTASGLFALTKVTAFLSVIPFFVVFALFSIATLKDRIPITKAYILATLIGLVILGPYVLRFFAYFENGLTPQVSSWIRLPPDPICGAYYWPQHLTSIIDFFSQQFGFDYKSKVITPKDCWWSYPGSSRLWIPHHYGSYMGLSIFLMILILSWKNKKAVLIALIPVLLIPVFHAMIYSNSSSNPRLIGFIWVFMAFAISHTWEINRNLWSWFLAMVLGSFSFFSIFSTNKSILGNIEQRFGSEANFEKGINLISSELSDERPVIAVGKPKGPERKHLSFGMKYYYETLRNDFNVHPRFTDGINPSVPADYLFLCDKTQENGKILCNLKKL